MLKIKLALLLISVISTSYCYSKSNECENGANDTVYNDLTKFLVKVGQLNEKMENTGKKYIELFEILTKNDTINFANIPFGVFKFSSNTCEDCGYYVLIKHYDKLTVVYQSNLYLIIQILFQIKKKDENLISCELFESYINSLLDIEQGINSGKIDLIEKIGILEYQFN
ncbi:MAG: hypothetical protein Q8T08_20995 [Ignavibacteria bacterium]|nr:hypothetical protein [Ignavibacteria bacterium]